MSTPRIAVIIGAGFGKLGGWPDTTAILDQWKAGKTDPKGDLFMADVEACNVPDISWAMLVEVLQATLASPGMNKAWRISPRYGDSLMQPSKIAAHGTFFAGVLTAGDLAGVVSLNYDLSVEKVLGPAPRPPLPGLHYCGPAASGLYRPSVVVPRDREREPLNLTGAVPVWKPHGSLNWHRSHLANITIYPDLRAVFRGSGEAAIIPPVRAETAIPRWQLGIWAGAADLLNTVDEWWVAGYSLPAADVRLEGSALDRAQKTAICDGSMS